MNKKRWLIPISAMVFLGLAGCGNRDAAVEDRYSDSAQPIGYYSNENHQGGNARLLDDNDGPVTEIMDHTLGDEDGNIRDQKARSLQVKDENGNPVNPTTPLANDDRNLFERDNRFSEADMNYHGHLDNSRVNNRSKTSRYDADLSTRVAKTAATVENVDDVRAVVYGDNVLITVDVNNNADDQKTIAAIRKEVQPLLDGRTVRVVTDEGTFSRIRGMDDAFSNGKVNPQMDLDLRKLFRQLGND